MTTASASMSDNTLAAVAGVLADLAHAKDLPRSRHGLNVTQMERANHFSIPGPETPDKHAVEQELLGLRARIEHLQAQESNSKKQRLPLTPNDSFTTAVVKSLERNHVPDDNGQSSPGAEEMATIHRMLTIPGMDADQPSGQTTSFTCEQLHTLREYINMQAETIRTQKDLIDVVSAQLEAQQSQNVQARGIPENDTESINVMNQESVRHQQANLAFQKALREIGSIVTAVANGDLSKKISIEQELDPEIATFKMTINKMVDQLQDFASQVTHLAKEVGTEGRLGGQAAVPGVSGIWRELQDSVNSMAENLTVQVREIALVTTAVARGDLSHKIERPAKGEILRLQQTINTMVDQLRTFATEVARVAREVGTEGRLGGQATVHNAQGTWGALRDDVNLMANNLTTQVREIAAVTTAVAEGDLSWKVRADVKGEILALKNTINSMVDRLSMFGSEVSKVAREVGTGQRL